MKARGTLGQLPSIEGEAQAVQEELRRVLETFKQYEDFYRERGRNPSQAIPQDVFVAQLEARRA